MDMDRCVCCGDIIPEGRMICPQCDAKTMKIGFLLQSIDATDEQVKEAYAFLKEELNNN